MASYCTRLDLEARIGADMLARIADLDGQGRESLDAVDNAIAAVDGIISSKIARVWPAYVGVSTPVLRPIATDLVIDRLAQGPATSADIQRQAKQARADLDAIARGDAMPDLTFAAPSDAGAGAVAFVSGRRAFSGGGY